MRKILIVVWIMFAVSVGKAQVNLVPNPSFELYDTCPNYISQINRANEWYAAKTSPDYFNTCSIDTDGIGQIIAGVPLNDFGYQLPSSGNAYVGLILHGPLNQDREAIGTQLTTPLQIGTKYYVSFKASLSGQGQYCGINKLGVLFSSIRFDANSPPPICNCSQIYTDSIITDTLNWTSIKGSFVADSNYLFINVGRFFDNALTNFIQLSGTSSGAYYFIDDICVSTDSTYAYNYNYNGINELQIQDTIDLYPNPARDWITVKGRNILSLTVYDVLGKMVFSFNSEINYPYLLNTASLNRGIYYLSVTTKIETIYKKIILN